MSAAAATAGRGPQLPENNNCSPPVAGAGGAQKAPPGAAPTPALRPLPARRPLTKR